MAKLDLGDDEAGIVTRERLHLPKMLSPQDREACVFDQAGAFLVSAGVLFYLYLADVSLPLLGTSFVQTPEVAAFRSAMVRQRRNRQKSRARRKSAGWCRGRAGGLRQ
jgi:hypothetical protein